MINIQPHLRLGKAGTDLVVGSRSGICAGRGGVITTDNGLAVCVVVKRTMSSSTMGRSDGGASHMSVVAGTVVMGTRGKGGMASCRGNGDSSDFRVAQLVVALLTLPEFVTRALGVAVGRAGSKTLLLLVVTAEQNLDRNGEKEEESMHC